MSAIKSEHEFRTIINIKSNKISEYKVKKILRETNVLSWESTAQKFTSIDNQIDIGIYRISLILNDKPFAKKLKDYGKFTIRIFELYPGTETEIDLRKDYRFKKYEWIRKNECGSFCINDLVKAILDCHKLDSLKIFN